MLRFGGVNGLGRRLIHEVILLIVKYDSGLSEYSCCTQSPCPPACSAWTHPSWTMMSVKTPILAWSHAEWCVPDTWTVAETHAMWVFSSPFFCFFFYTKCLQRPHKITAPCLRVTWNTVYQLELIPLCLSGWLWQPSGVFRSGPRPGVMGSRMCPAWLPWSLRQSVWVPLLDWGCLCSQPLKKPPPRPLFGSPNSLYHHLCSQRPALFSFLSGVLFEIFALLYPKDNTRARM